MTWSRELFQFVLCGHPTPRCWSSQERELSSRVRLFRSRLRTLGTHYHPTLDPAVLWTPSNDTSRPICSDSLTLVTPVPLYLRTLYRYINAVIYLFCIRPPRITEPVNDNTDSISKHRLSLYNVHYLIYNFCTQFPVPVPYEYEI